MSRERLPLSTREIGTWGSLLSTLAIYAIFLGASGAGVSPGGQVGLLIGLVVAQVVVMVLLHVVLALVRGEEPADERDALIELRAVRWAYAVLSAGLGIITTIYLLWGAAAAEPGGPAMLSLTQVGHSVLVCFVAAEVVKGVTQVVLYRRGVRGVGA